MDFFYSTVTRSKVAKIQNTNKGGQNFSDEM